MVADLERRQLEWSWEQAVQQHRWPVDPNDGHLYHYHDETKTYEPMVALDMSWMDE